MRSLPTWLAVRSKRNSLSVECEKGKKVFEVKNLNAGRLVRDINFSLYEGEIVGFAGLMGAGRTETTRAIFGVDPKDIRNTDPGW